MARSEIGFNNVLGIDGGICVAARSLFLPVVLVFNGVVNVWKYVCGKDGEKRLDRS